MKLPILALLLSAAAAFAQTPLPPLPPDGFVTLQQIVSDFTNQPDAALQKYQGQRLVVYGRVGQVTQSDDKSGDPLTVFLQLASTTTPDVKCVFGVADLPGGEQDATMQISNNDEEAVGAHRDREGNISYTRPFIEEGKIVGIRGTFDNFVAGDVVLKDCRKLRPVKIKKILAENGVKHDE